MYAEMRWYRHQRKEDCKCPGPSDVSLDLIAASEEVGIQAKTEIYYSSKWICYFS